MSRPLLRPQETTCGTKRLRAIPSPVVTEASQCRGNLNVIQYKIRVREDLRRRLEGAAKKRDVSINYEMTSRLAASFDREEMFKLGMVAEDIKSSGHAGRMPFSKTSSVAILCEPRRCSSHY